MAKVKSLCVYCGSSNRVAAVYKEAAYALGQSIGRAGIDLVYGGGRVGLMGLVADGALAEGSKVTGIIPRHLHELEVAHPGVTELLVVDTMHERKQLMAERSDGFAILPGGFGTLDEMFEMLTWRQLHLHDKPIVLIDIDNYWEPLMMMVTRIIESGFAIDSCRGLFQRVTSIDDLFVALEGAQEPALPVESKWL